MLFGLESILRVGKERKRRRRLKLIKVNSKLKKKYISLVWLCSRLYITLILSEEGLKKYETNPIYRKFEYVLRERKDCITFLVYGEVGDCFERLSRPYNDVSFLNVEYKKNR